MKKLAIRSNLKIKRQKQTDWLMQVMVFLPLLQVMMTEYLYIPTAIEHLLDVIWVVLILYILCTSNAYKRRNISPMVLWTGLFFSYTLIVYLFRFQSPLYYLWGFRNNFRFYVAFLAFCVFVDNVQAERYLDVMDKLFWLNLVLTLIQYAMGYRFDFLGGIFGTTVGCNAYSNIFMLIIVVKSLVYCFNNKESLSMCMLKCFTALLIAALAELKFFFAEFLFVGGLVFCMTRYSGKKMLLVTAAGVGVLVGIALLAQLYPHFADAFIPSNFISIATSDKGYTMQGDFNRLTVISNANEQFLHSTADRLFGLGLGNCDTSSFAFLETPFARAHADRTHYHWFSTSFIYLEIGYIGLLLFFGFFGLVFLCAHGQERKRVNPLHCQIAKVMALCSILIGIYNVSLRTEAGYMVYFVLALPFMKTVQLPERVECDE